MCGIGAGTRGLEVAVTSVRNGNPRGTDNLRDSANEAPSRNHARGLGIRWRSPLATCPKPICRAVPSQGRACCHFVPCGSRAEVPRMLRVGPARGQEMPDRLLPPVGDQREDLSERARANMNRIEAWPLRILLRRRPRHLLPMPGRPSLQRREHLRAGRLPRAGGRGLAVAAANAGFDPHHRGGGRPTPTAQ